MPINVVIGNLESVLENQCKRIAENNGCTFLKIEKRKGWPDRLLMWNGQIMFIELKREKSGSMGMYQKHIQQMLRAQNFLHEEVDNRDLFLKLVLQLKASSPQPGTPNPTKQEAQNG